jgi:RimJ/RimL family protein N-acetyltransferase
MLKPAQLYKDKLQEENIKSWYKPENIYWHGGTAEYEIDLPDNNGNCHCFVSVDKNDNVIGWISYNVDWVSMSADGWGIISFDKGNMEFAKDLYKAICDCFEVYHLNRISWNCYADNPAIRGYRNFIKKYGGRECAYFRQYIKLMDGKLHDSVSFEILAEEFNGRSRKNERRTNADRIRSMSDEELANKHVYFVPGIN